MTAVATHEEAHKEIERKQGTMEVAGGRTENVTDVCAVTFLGMDPQFAHYGYDDADVAAAKQIHG